MLNACYSEFQANVIANHIPYVIGMTQAIGDKSALEFAIGFYDALGAGESIEFAYEFGCNAIRLAGIEEYLIPVFKKKTCSKASTELTNLDNPRGIVDVNSSFYIERLSIESRCYESIIRPSALVRIQAPWQMGKSSLMIRVLHYASKKDHTVVSLNLQEAESKVFIDYAQFLYWFCGKLAEQLGLQNELEEYWSNEKASRSMLCSRYIEKSLLNKIDTPLVIAIDEFDLVFQNPYLAKSFLGLLRAWHERGHIREIWRKLKIIIVHCQDIGILWNDIQASPFNAGELFELPEFNQEQVMDLAKRHGLNLSNEEIERLTDLIGGHPYLTRVSLYQAAQQKLILEKLNASEGACSEHLNYLLSFLETNLDLKEAMKQIIDSAEPVELPWSIASRLRSLGLIKTQKNKCRLSCNLYRQYFQIHLVS